MLPPDSVITIVLRPLFGNCLKRRRESSGGYLTLQRTDSSGCIHERVAHDTGFRDSDPRSWKYDSRPQATHRGFSIKDEEDDGLKREVELQHSLQKKNRPIPWEYYGAEAAEAAEAYLRDRYLKWRDLEANFLSPKDSDRARISRTLSMDFNSIDLEDISEPGYHGT